MKKVLLITITLLCAGNLSAQDITSSKIVRAEIVDGDTILVQSLRIVLVYEPRTFSSKKEKRRYSKLKRDVLKVYPYAKLAGERLRDYESRMDVMKNEREKKKFLKLV